MVGRFGVNLWVAGTVEGMRGASNGRASHLRAWRQWVKNACGFTLVWLGAKVVHRVRFTKSPAIPAAGPVIVVANHLSVTEPLAVARLVIGHRRFPHFLVMREAFSWPVVGWLLRLAGQIPVVRGSVTAGDSLQPATAQLEAGHVVALYPEGRLTREKDFMPGPAKTGAARLALQFPHVPVIPVGQWGPKPGAKHVWRRRPAKLCVGAPVDLVAFLGREDSAAAREATEVIMGAIRRQVLLARQQDRVESSTAPGDRGTVEP